MMTRPIAIVASPLVVIVVVVVSVLIVLTLLLPRGIAHWSVHFVVVGVGKSSVK
jgi:hypothetical protein